MRNRRRPMLIVWLLSALTACVTEPLDLPAAPPDFAIVRAESPVLGRRYVGSGSAVVLTFQTDAPVGRGPFVRVGNADMACVLEDAGARRYKCSRDVDETPALAEGEHPLTVAAAAVGTPADWVPTPVELSVRVTVDRTRPVLAARGVPPLVTEGQAFTFEVLTTEPAASERPPTFEASAGALELGASARFSAGWLVSATIRGTSASPVVPADTLSPSPGDPDPAIVVRQIDEAGNEASSLRVPLVVRTSAPPRIRLERLDRQRRPGDGAWVPVTNLRSRVSLEFAADRPISEWQGASIPDLPLQCQPMPPDVGEASTRVWRALCFGITPNDWADEAIPLQGLGTAIDATDGSRWPVPFELRFDLVAPEVQHPENLVLVRHDVGRNDELSTTAGRLRSVARDRGAYVGTALVPAISHLLVYADAAGGVPLLRLAMPDPAAPDDAPIVVALPGTSGLDGPALPRVFVAAVDLFGNESTRRPLPDDGAATVDGRRLGLVRTDDLTGDELRFEPGAFNAGSDTACPIVRVDLFPDGIGQGFPVAVLDRTGAFLPQRLSPAPRRLFVEAVDKAGRTSARVEVANADAVPPAVDAERLEVVRTPVGAPDAVAWAPGAFDGDRADASPIVAVRFFGAERTPSVLSEALAPALGRSGAFSSPLALGTAARGPEMVFVEATDETGLTSARVEVPGADLQPPQLVPGLFVFERLGAEIPDRIAWQAQAATDPSAIVALRFYASAASTEPLVRWDAPAGSHSLASGAVEMPFEDRSIEHLFVEAEDKTGRSSLRLEIPGADERSPLVAPDLFVVERSASGEADRIAWQAGAATDASAVVTLRFYGSASAAAPLVRWDAPTGSRSLAFGAVEMPFTDRSIEHLFVEAQDKTGRSSLRVELPGADEQAPQVSPGLFALQREAVGAADRIAWLARAATDASAIVELRFYEGAAEPSAIARWQAPPGSHALTPGSMALPFTDRSIERLFVEAMDKTGRSSARVEVTSAADVRAPVVQAALLAIVRRPLGVPDRVEALGDALDDDSAIAAVELLDGPEGARLALLVPAADGTFAPVEVGSGLSAPGRVFLRATDKAGHASGAVEIATGRDVMEPSVFVTRWRIHREAVGTQDWVAWGEDAATDASAVREIRLYESASLAELPFATFQPADGALRLVPGSATFPDPTRSPRTVWVQVVDKTGAASPRAELASEADVRAPAVDASRMRIERRGTGLTDRVVTSEGAVEDPSAIVRVEFRSQAGGSLLGALVPNADGSFPPAEVGSASTAPRRVFVTVIDKVGDSTGPLEIVAGSEPGNPVVVPSLAGIDRRPLGVRDLVAGRPGALSGGAAPVQVEVFDAALATVPLAVVAAAEDGSFAAAEIGSLERSFASLWFTAIDKAGGRSARVEGLLGLDRVPPSIDTEQARILRARLGVPDSVRAGAGTCADSSSVALYELFADVDGNAPLASGEPAADGTLADVVVGSGSAAPPRVYLRCLDKAGNAGAIREILYGRDVEPPSVNYAQLLFTEAASPAQDYLAGSDAAITDTLSQVRLVRVFSSPLDDGSPPLATVTPTSLGAFASIGLGDTTISGIAGLYLDAEDKCGNRSDRATNRANLYSITTRAQVPYGFSPGAARIYTVAADVNPASASPAIGPSLWPELDASANARAAAADASVVEVSAATETRSVAPTWTRLPLLRPQFAKVVYDSGASRIVAIAPGASALEMFAWDGERWIPLGAANAPPARTDFSLAHDPLSHRTYLLGGRSGATVLGDLWSYDGVAWQQEAGGPPARYGASLTFDPDNDRLVLVGGTSANATALADQWTFSAGTWTDTTVSPAPGGAGTCFAHNPDGRELLLTRSAVSGCGGLSTNHTNETWSLKGSAWTRISTACESTGWEQGCVFVPAGAGLGGDSTARIVGVRRASGTTGTHSFVNLSAGARWSAAGTVTAAQLGDERWISLAYDPVRREFIAIEVYLQSAGYPTYAVTNAASGRNGGVRRLAMNGAAIDAAMAIAGTVFSRRYDNGAGSIPGHLFFRPRTRELAWGVGRSRSAEPGLGAFFGHAGEWRVSGNQVGSNVGRVGYFAHADFAWIQQGTSSASVVSMEGPTVRPTAPAWATAENPNGVLYVMTDPLLDGVVLYGASYSDPPHFTPRGGASARWYSGLSGLAHQPAVYDPVRGRGQQLWARNGTTLEQWDLDDDLVARKRAIAAMPSYRLWPSLAYDAGLNRLVLHGGTDASNVVLSDTWEFDGAAWTRMTPAGSPPTAEAGDFAYDAATGRHLRLTAQEAWEYEHVEPHRRYAAAIGFFPYEGTETILNLIVRASAGGASPAGDGYAVYAWDFAARRWDVIGTSMATPASSPEARALRVTLAPTTSTKYLRKGAWLLVTANASNVPGESAVESRLALDALEFQVLTQVR